MDYSTVSMIVGVSLSIGFALGAVSTMIIFEHAEKRKEARAEALNELIENWKKENQ